MTQPLWYLRHEGKVYGPFPGPQIEESLQSGRITLAWEISLNETDWLSIAESGQFEPRPSTGERLPAADDPSWRDEREKARQRWRHTSAADEVPEIRDPAADEIARLSVSRDHVRTQALLQAAQTRHPRPWSLLIALALLLVIGIGIWWAQTNDPEETRLQVGLRQAFETNCEAPLAASVNWRGCDKTGLSAPNIPARNAILETTRLRGADLAGADLAYVDARGVDLRDARLNGANLSGAHLAEANLSGADLSNADLRFAVLKSATLTGTRLDGARLGKAEWPDGRICAEDSVGACR